MLKLDEAEQLCDRVGIINHGQLLALGSTSELIATLGGDYVVEFTLDRGIDGDNWTPDALSTLPAVRSVHAGPRLISLSVSEPHVMLPALVSHLEQRNRRLTSLSTRHASLDSVFLKLAGQPLHDPDDASA
jgi:ABC-2 type transport system ATP-binding protein